MTSVGWWACSFFFPHYFPFTNTTSTDKSCARAAEAFRAPSTDETAIVRCLTVRAQSERRGGQWRIEDKYWLWIHRSIVCRLAGGDKWRRGIGTGEKGSRNDGRLWSYVLGWSTNVNGGINWVKSILNQTKRLGCHRRPRTQPPRQHCITLHNDLRPELSFAEKKTQRKVCLSVPFPGASFRCVWAYNILLPTLPSRGRESRILFLQLDFKRLRRDLACVWLWIRQKGSNAIFFSLC